MLHSLDHVVIAVRDLADATERYSALLGLSPSWRGEHPDAGTANTLYRLANTYLELLSPTSSQGTGAMIEAALAQRGEGVTAMCFGADDADAFAAAMRAHGIEAVGPQAGEGRAEGSDAVRRWRTVMLPGSATRGLFVFAIEHESPDDALLVAKPDADAAGCVRALDHIVVSSPDLDATGRLYGDTFGLRLALDKSFEGRGLRMLFFRVGGVTVECVGRLGREADPSAPDAFGGLAYQVPDADAARRRITEAGFDVSEVRDGHKPGTRVFTVRDGTCGVPTLVIEPATGTLR